MPAISENAPELQGIDWFADASLREGLGRKSARGLSVTFSSQVLKLIVNTLATAVLGRLLTPGDFGLIAMLISVTGIAHIFRDLGLPLATIQRARLTEAECNCIFWLTVLIGAGVTLLVALSGPMLAWFFADARVGLIAAPISLTFLLASLGSQHQALLRRHMRFGKLAWIEVGSTVGSFAVAIAMATRGAGFWALVIQQVSLFLISTILLWLVCSWRPGFPAWQSSVKDMVGYGRNVTLSNLMNYAGRNVDNILVGKVSGAAALGFYSKAYQLLLLPIWQINAPMSAVAMPALSRLQDDPVEFRRFYLKAIFGMVLLGMPIVSFMFVRADQIVFLFLGPAWKDAAYLFRLLAPAAFMDTFNLAGGLVLQALGHTGRQLRLTIVSTALILLSFGIGIIWGAPGVALAFSIVIVLSRFPAIVYSFIDSPLRIEDLLRVLWRPALMSLIAGAVLYCLPAKSSDLVNVVFSLSWAGILFFAIYLIGLRVLPGGSASLQDATTVWRRMIGSRV